MRLDHARILFAYLSNFPLSEMEALKNATETWVNAALNGNYSEAVNARAGFYATVANATNNLIERDFRYIEQVINEEIRG
jgi:shikimate kinase